MNKKTKIVIVALLLLMASAAQAQIFLQEGDENNMRDVTTVPVNAWPENPPYNQGIDNYTPLGSGIVLLAALGGVYLLKNKKNNK